MSSHSLTRNVPSFRLLGSNIISPRFLGDGYSATLFMDHPVIAELAKATPPATIVMASWFYGVQWNQIAYFVTAIYTLGLVIQQGYRLYRWVKNKQKERKYAKRFRRPK